MKIGKPALLGSLSLLAMSILPAPSYAIEQTGPLSAGVLLGPTFSNSSTIFTFGAEGNYEWMPPFGAGVSVTYFAKDFAGIGYNSSFTTLTAEGLYYFAKEYPQLAGLRAGLQLGLGFTGSGVPNSSGSTDLIVGPTAAYDYKIASQLSVGAESTLYFTTRANSGASLQLLGAIRYWF